MKDTKAVRPNEELDWKKLEGYLHEQLENLDGEMSVEQFHGGHANLTYLLRFGEREFVLRRPPFGKIAPGAHDMKREYRVLSKLYKYLPEAPRAYHLCEDETIVGARFVVMQRCKGVVVRSKLPESFTQEKNVLSRLTNALLRSAADLHSVDVEAADLTALGKPDGFAERQIGGWNKRWNLSKTWEVADMDYVYDALKSSIPTPQSVSLIHNDLKFDNCQFQPDNPDKVTAIFDWDMCTTGDPLIDFGGLLAYFPEKSVPDMMRILPPGDYPDKSEMIARYSDMTGFNTENIWWYESFAYWKTAIILQQLYKRYADGATKDERMAKFGKMAKMLGGFAKAKVRSNSV